MNFSNRTVAIVAGAGKASLVGKASRPDRAYYESRLMCEGLLREKNATDEKEFNATIRINVMTWGNSLLVRGKASFCLE